MNPATKTRVASIAFAVTLTVGAIVLAPTQARGATTTQPTSGPGWKFLTNVTHLDGKPFTIAFHDTTSRIKLTPYVRKVAAELTSYGIPVVVSTRIVPTTKGKCPPSHTIAYRWISKPNPAVPNQSFTGTCTLAGAPYSAYVYINSDYWATGRRFPEWQRMNVIWHESGHAVGLSHPATCPTNKAGYKPLMCADAYKDLRDRRYTSFEATAFRQLNTNRLALR